MDHVGHFMIFTKQPDEAEKIIHEAESEITSITGTNGLGTLLRKDGWSVQRQRQRHRDEKME